jgi:hypothetical protein
LKKPPTSAGRSTTPWPSSRNGSPAGRTGPFRCGSVWASASPWTCVRGQKVEQAVLAAGVPAAEVRSSPPTSQVFLAHGRVLPALKARPVHRLLIRFAEEKGASGKLRRYYPEPSRWLQELYPVDEILARDLNLPLERVEFEMKEQAEPLYEVVAFDERNAVLLQQGFSPPVRDMPYLSALPEWGTSQVRRVGCDWKTGSRPLPTSVSPPTGRNSGISTRSKS